MLLIIFNGETPPLPAFLVQPSGPIPVIVQSSEGNTKQITLLPLSSNLVPGSSPRGDRVREVPGHEVLTSGVTLRCNQMQSWNSLNGPLSFQGRDPFNQNYRKFRSKTQWIGSVPTGKVSKKLVQLLRWTSFLGRTSRKFWLNRSRPYEHYM